MFCVFNVRTLEDKSCCVLIYTSGIGGWVFVLFFVLYRRVSDVFVCLM